jgi:hypothetical protein
LENILVLAPVCLLLLKRLRLPLWLTVLSSPVVLALVFYFAIHATSLGTYYLSGLPESSFSLRWFPNNFAENAVFLLKFGRPILVLAMITSLWAVLRLRRPDHDVGNRWVPLAVLSYPVLVSLLLLFYSVGQYGFSGGTRFLAMDATILSIVSAAAIFDTPGFRGWRWIAGLAWIFSLAVSPRQTDIEKFMTRSVASAQREHEAIRRWAAYLPADAVVLSHMPYIWENFGKFSSIPELAKGKHFGNSPIYFHYGISSGSEEWPPGLQPQDRVVTEYGAVCLFRLP